MVGALNGIRVIEWGGYHVGSNAGSILQALGAEVIKIEEPRFGDPARAQVRVLGVPVVSPDGYNYFFEFLNRNKKSVTLNLKHEEGRKIACALIQKADVFLTNFRGRAASKLGMDYEALRKHNPKLIYARCTAFGQHGPDADSPGVDLAGMARGGLTMAMRSDEERPHVIYGLGDEMGSISTVLGILAALVARRNGDLGQEVDASILGGVVWLQTTLLGIRALTGQKVGPFEATSPLYNLYQTSDKRWFCLSAAISPDKYWPLVCRAIERPELANDERYDATEKREVRRQELFSLLEKAFASHTLSEWLNRFRELDIPAAPVNNHDTIFNDQQVVANNYLIQYQHPNLGLIRGMGFPVEFSRTPPNVAGPAPLLGQHTEEVLLNELEMAWDDIGRLREAGVI